MKDFKSCVSDDDAVHYLREQLIADLQQAEGSSEFLERAPSAAQDATATELSSLNLKSCRQCNAGGKLMLCTKCKAAYYCSKEHQRADWLNGHKESCKAPGSEKQPSLVGLPLMETSEKPLRLEMLELLEIFRSVHKDTPGEIKEFTLRKAIHVCEQIIRRGNLDKKFIPQVFYMLQGARQMLRPFKLEREGIIEPEEVEPEPNVEPEPRIEISNKQKITKKRNSKKSSGKNSAR